jgi:hypothetical protein
MSSPSFATEAGLAGNYPSNRFNQRERRLLESVLEYLNAGLSASQLASGSVTLAKLATGVTPSHIIKYAARRTTAGGAAAEDITLTGALATDLAFVRLVSGGTNTVTVSSWVMAAGKLTVTFSGDPGADAVIEYQVLRAAA